MLRVSHHGVSMLVHETSGQQPGLDLSLCRLVVATTGLGGSILEEQEMAGKLQMFPGPGVFPAPTLSGTSGMSKLLLGPDSRHYSCTKAWLGEFSQPGLTRPGLLSLGLWFLPEERGSPLGCLLGRNPNSLTITRDGRSV